MGECWRNCVALPVLLTPGYGAGAQQVTQGGFPLLRKPYRPKVLDDNRSSLVDAAPCRHLAATASGIPRFRGKLTKQAEGPSVLKMYIRVFPQCLGVGLARLTAGPPAGCGASGNKCHLA
jgi:hypothetical protein